MSIQPTPELLDDPSADLTQFLEDRITEFNRARWTIKEKRPIGVRVRDESGAIIAGTAAKTFGNWLLIDNIWVSDAHRGRALGTQVLKALEDGARGRGCRYALLDTLGFQARPFYERFGYVVRWTQGEYPDDGVKYHMTKDL